MHFGESRDPLTQMLASLIWRVAPKFAKSPKFPAVRYAVFIEIAGMH